MPQDEAPSETPLLQSCAPNLLTHMKIPHRARPMNVSPRALEKQIRYVPPDTGHRFHGSWNNLNRNPPSVMRNGHPY